LLLVLPLLAGPALAQERPGCWVPYAAFEEHVRHIDAESCPAGGPAPGDGFCRIAIFQGSITVHEFRAVDDQPCLTAAHRMELADFLARNGTGPGAHRPR
jgi:hypothetical protein